MAEAVAEEYRSSLADLNFNSKPHINMLTMLAEDNVQHAPLIVDTIVKHIRTVPPDLKLPSLYLVDSIMKNIGVKYVADFSKHMVELFSSVFEKVDEVTRSALYKLRQTWNDILPKTILYGIDCRVHYIDPAWPITAQVTSSIHVNPKFVSGPAIAAQNLVKESEIKKKQEEMKKLIEEKAEKAKYLKLIEEKKAELKLLEAKKLTLQHAKLKTMESNLLKHQKSLGQAVIHRDPRLKKVAALIASETAKNSNKTTPSSLQSVVIIPNSDKKKPSTTDAALPQLPATKENSLMSNTVTTSHPQFKANSNTIKLEETYKKNSVSVQKRTIEEQQSSNDIFNKRPRLDSLPLNDLKINQLQNKEVNAPSINNPMVELHSNSKQIDSAKEPRYEDKNKLLISSDRLPEVPLFLGTEDKDYRKIPPQALDPPKLQKDMLTSISKSSSQQKNENIAVNLPPEMSRSSSECLIAPCERINPPNQASELGPSLSQPVELISGREPIKPSTNLNQAAISRGEIPVPNTESFTLDGKDRTIHFVNKKSFVILDDERPYEIRFVGSPRNVFIDELPQPLSLSFNNSVEEFDIGGKKHIIQFGTPQRELYIDNHPFKANFGGPSLAATLENKVHHIRVEGPPPKVLIGDKPSYELYEEFKQMKDILPCPSEPSSVIQNQVSVKHSTGTGKDVDMRDKSNPLKPPPFFESTVAKLKDVDYRHAPVSEHHLPTFKIMQISSSISTFSQSSSSMSNAPFGTETLPVASLPPHSAGIFSGPHNELRPSLERPPIVTPFHNELHRPIRPLLPPPSLPPALSSLPPPPPLPNLPPMDTRPRTWEPLPPPPMFPAKLSIMPNRQKVPLLPTPTSQVLPTLNVPITSAAVPEIPQSLAPLSPIDVGSIFEKLVAAGIISKKDPVSTETSNKFELEEKSEIPSKEEKEKSVPKIELNPKSLKQFYPGVLIALYKGSQCATCGMRFKNSQGEQYGRHLDWHFRMNRREKDGAKKAYSRKLFYVLKDWIQFTEIEEAEERAPSYFELQADGMTAKNEEDEKIHSVRASECETEKCSVCGEKFQLFWVEEEEEWHLRHAVRHDGEAYHPACYEDFQKASRSPVSEADVSKEDIAEDNDVQDEKMEIDEPHSPSKDDVNINILTKEEPMEEEMANDLETAVLSIKKEPVEDDLEIPVVADQKIIIKTEPEESTEPVQTLVPELSEEENGKSKIIVYIKDEFFTDEETEEANDSSDEVVKNEDEKPQKEIGDKEKNKTDLDNEPLPNLKIESSDEDEFRPPTPDPRFEVLPPTFKGTELSALCTIM